MSKRDYYDVLGVSRSASQDEIKAAYRELARKFHPDINKDAGAQERFVEAQEAYDTLSDEQKKQMYDRFGHAGMGGGQGPRPGSGAPGGFEVDDLGSMFDSFFGGRNAGPFGAQQGPRRQKPRTPDTRHSIEIDFVTSIIGGKKHIDIKQGTESNAVDVAIPAGIIQGKKLRVRGVGHADPNRPGKKSDLILTINVAAHPLFRRGDPALNQNPSDVYFDLPITFAEAALGAKIDVPTPTGTATIGIPPGSMSGSKLRLKDQGCKTSPTGDLYAVLQITPPPKDAIDDDAAAVLKKLGASTPIRVGQQWPSPPASASKR